MTVSLARLRVTLARQRALPTDDYPGRDAQAAASDRRTIAILTLRNAALTREVEQLRACAGHQVRVPEQWTGAGS